jgi:serine/threonine-protein kinase RsbW
MNSLRIIADSPPTQPPMVYERSWPSRIDMKMTIIDEMVSYLMDHGYAAEDDRTWLYLCFDEVVVNAMLHGNEGDPRLPIEVTIRLDEQRWVVTVADQGEGFEATQIPDHNDPQALMFEHGRGIRIMQEWLDELIYYNRGSCAWLSRRRADRPHSESENKS